jgi:hypothetical protein
MIKIYAKKQRAKRKDPQQEAIVAEKDVINERTKKLIALMISMKKGWNGGPSPDIGVEKFNLTQPIPDVVVGTGEAALHELSDIMQTLHQIKSMQDTYAITHGQRSEVLKKLKEQNNQSQELTTSVSVPKPQIAEAVTEELLKKTASNPLTRIWTHLTAYNPFASEKNRGYRLELLRSLARIDRGLEDIEDKILSQDESSILDSVYVAKQLYSDAKSSFFGDFRKNINQMLSDAEEELKAAEEEQKKIKSRPVIRSTIPEADAKGSQIDISKALSNAQNTLAATLTEIESKPKEISTQTITPADSRGSEINLSNLTEQAPVLEDKIPDVEQVPVAEEDKTIPKDIEVSKQKIKKSPKQKLKRKKVPIAPVPVQSDFIDSDFEQVQREKYEKIREYVFKHVDTLFQECFNIANSNLLKFWKLKIRDEAKKVRELAIALVKEIENHEDFDINYAHFLEGVGIIKALDYIAKIEAESLNNDPNFVIGSLFNEVDIKFQAINFAKEQMRIFIAMNQKVSQANVASRFIKRMITHIMPRRDKSLRLTISRNLRNAMNGLQKLLNILEQRNIDFRKLMDASQTFLESLSFVFEGLADIGDMYNSTMRMEKSIRKQRSVKMTYDMIPVSDINSLRSASKSMLTDLFNIQKLDQLESDLANPQGTNG